MNEKDIIVEIELGGQKYNSKIDMRTIANVQTEFKLRGLDYNLNRIMSDSYQDWNVVIEFIVQSILRCHKTLNRNALEDKMFLSEKDNMFKYFDELVIKSFPAAPEGKQEEE